jgi:hypothetical protein
MDHIALSLKINIAGVSLMNNEGFRGGRDTKSKIKLRRDCL